MINAQATSKADVLAALRQSMDYGAAVLKEFNDQQLMERVTSLPFLGAAGKPAARRLYFDQPQSGHLRIAGRVPAIEWRHAAGEQSPLAVSQ